MSTIDDGGPAFAAAAVGPMGDVHQQPGMSLRDWFAGQVAPTIFAELHAQLRQKSSAVSNAYEIVAGASYELADAMLAERAKAVQS